jgi:Luciferase-like monooxygenase
MRALVYWARLIGCDSCLVADSLQNFVPTALWDPHFTWAATQAPSAHVFLDWPVLLGDLARRAGRLHLGVGVTDPTRRHPVLLAQAILTLAHLTHRAPILGLGAGERLNLAPYGLDFTTPVGRVEEALQIIRACLSDHDEPITFQGRHYQLEDAAFDLCAPAGSPHVLPPRLRAVVPLDDWQGESGAHRPDITRCHRGYAEQFAASALAGHDGPVAAVPVLRQRVRVVRHPHGPHVVRPHGGDTIEEIFTDIGAGHHTPLAAVPVLD